MTVAAVALNAMAEVVLPLKVRVNVPPVALTATVWVSLKLPEVER